MVVNGWIITYNFNVYSVLVVILSVYTKCRTYYCTFKVVCCIFLIKIKFGCSCYCLLSVIETLTVFCMNITFMNRWTFIGERSKVEWSISGSQEPGIKRYPRGAPKEIHILSKVVINETFPVDDKWKSVYETTNLILYWLNTSWFHGNLILFVVVGPNWSYMVSFQKLGTKYVQFFKLSVK